MSKRVILFEPGRTQQNLLVEFTMKIVCRWFLVLTRMPALMDPMRTGPTKEVAAITLSPTWLL